MRTLSRTVGARGCCRSTRSTCWPAAHLVPLYSRMGAYDATLLQRASSGQEQRRLVEYWAHVQALMPVGLWPHMALPARRLPRPPRQVVVRGRGRPSWRRGCWRSWRRAGRRTSRDLDDGLPRARTTGAGTGRAPAGSSTTSSPSATSPSRAAPAQFEVLYDLPERVLPAAVLAVPTPTVAEQHLELVRRAAASHGVATLRCLADYHRMRIEEVKPAVAAMVEDGRARGRWDGGVAAPGLPAPRRPSPAAGRRRGPSSAPSTPWCGSASSAEHLFDFSYRIEIYTPARKRVHGFTCCRSCCATGRGRANLKADRQAGVAPPPGGVRPARRPRGHRGGRWLPSSGSWRAGWASTTSSSPRAATSPLSSGPHWACCERDATPPWVQ